MDSSSSREETYHWAKEYNNNTVSLCNQLSRLDIQCFDSSDVRNEIENDGTSHESESGEPSFSISDITADAQLKLEDVSYESDDSDESYVTAPSSPDFLFNFYVNGYVIYYYEFIIYPFIA